MRGLDRGQLLLQCTLPLDEPSLLVAARLLELAHGQIQPIGIHFCKPTPTALQVGYDALKPPSLRVLPLLDGFELPLNGKNLFVADINDRKIYKYDINKNGTLSNRRLFVPMGSDGMTLDNKGNLYITGQGVTVFNPEGKKIINIPLPGWTANVCFGGVNRDLLFITSNISVYTLQMKVKGSQ